MKAQNKKKNKKSNSASFRYLKEARNIFVAKNYREAEGRAFMKKCERSCLSLYM